MNEQLKILIELQGMDDRIVELKEKLAAIPGQVERLRSGYQGEQQALDSLKASLEAVTRDRRHAERELEIHEDKIKKLKEQQFMVKTNKEYQTFVHEIEVQEAKKGHLEETVLLMLDKAADMERKIKEQEARLAQEKGVFQCEEKRLQEEMAGLRGDLAEAEREREGVVGVVVGENLRNYHKLREFHHGKAVAAVVEGICQGCFMALRPQRLQEAKKNDNIITCDQCNRIIYYLEMKGAAEPPTRQES